MNRQDITDRARKVLVAHYVETTGQAPGIELDHPLIGGGSHRGTDAVGDLDSLDHVEIVMAIEEEFDVEIPDSVAEELKTFGDLVGWLGKQLGAQAAADVDEERCIACEVAFKEGDMVLNDVSGGALHTACCGPERACYVKDIGTGEPLGPDDPLPEGYAWSKWPKAAAA